jgi:hypothetical protein
MMVLETTIFSTLHFTMKVVARGSNNRNHFNENYLKNCAKKKCKKSAKNCQAKIDVHDHQDSEFLDD